MAIWSSTYDAHFWLQQGLQNKFLVVLIYTMKTWKIKIFKMVSEHRPRNIATLICRERRNWLSTETWLDCVGRDPNALEGTDFFVVHISAQFAWRTGKWTYTT